MADGEGLRARLARIPGQTPKGVLGRPLVLPAVVRTFGWTEDASHSEYDTLRAGQFSQPAMGPATARRLRQLDDIETLTLTWDPPWLVNRGLDPHRVYSDLFAVLRSRRPVQLTVTPANDERAVLRMKVTIRSIATQIREGEPDTRYYVLRITEWREADVSRRSKRGGDSSKLPTTHKLAAEDTLYSLSQRYYKSAMGGAADIAKANRIKGWGKKDPLVGMRRFKVGDKITIPKVELVGVVGTQRGRI